MLSNETILELVAKYEAEIAAAQRRFDRAKSERARQAAWDDRCAAMRTWNKWNEKAWRQNAYDADPETAADALAFLGPEPTIRNLAPMTR